MIKNIKRVGIIFLAIAIICLMVIGCLSVNSVQSDFFSKELVTKDIVNDGARDMFDYNVPSPLYTISGANGYSWDEAINKSISNRGAAVEFRLTSTWMSERSETGIMTNGNYSTDGSPYVPRDAHIILNLNGYSMNKQLANSSVFGSVIYVAGVLDIVDNSNSGDMCFIRGGNGGDGVSTRNISGGGITVHSGGILNICSSTVHIADNYAVYGSGVYVNNGGEFNLFSGQISDNVIHVYDKPNYYGAGICMSSNSVLRLYGGKVIENNITNDSMAGNYANGAGIYLFSNVDFHIANNPILKNNRLFYAEMIEGTYTSTTYFDDIFLNGNIIKVDGNLSNHYGDKAEIGIPYSTELNKRFTQGFEKNNTMLAEEVFYVSKNLEYNKDYSATNFGGEAVFVKNDSLIDWYCNGNKVTNYLSEEYNGDRFVIIAKDRVGNLLEIGNETFAKSFTATDAGIYQLNVKDSIAKFAITILPKEITSLNWGNTQFTYNGEVQVPTASLSEDPNAKVVVSGGMTNAGIYKAYATGLENCKNYKLASNISTQFTISPANLQVDITTNNVEYGYTGYNAKPSDWYTLSTTGLLGNDSNQSLSRLFTINDNAFIPQFNGKDGAVDLGEYTISTKPINNVNLAMYGNNNYNVTFNYINSGKLSIVKPSVVRTSTASKYNYLVYENNRRVTYAEKGWIHGVDDNARSANDLVLGNIMPNTSVQSFLDNLVFNDMTALTLKNSKGETIYTNGEIDSKYSALINNGMELAIGTGWTLEYERESITLSVLGDLTGDGKVNSADVNVARQIVNSNSFDSLDNYMKYSMLIINKGNIPNGTDTAILWNVVCGKMDIESFI